MEPSNDHSPDLTDLQTIVSFKLLQLKFKNDHDDFTKHSFLHIQACLNRISTTWKAISFANEQKYFIFKEVESKAIDEFLVLKIIHIPNVSIEVDLSCTNELNKLNKNKRFIHHKNIIIVEDDIIMEYFRNQNVSSLFRIKRKDCFGNQISTGSLIIQFRDNHIPSYVSIEFVQIKVQNLESRPMRCNYCFKFGHTITRCRNVNQRLCNACHYPVDEKSSENHVCIEDCKNCHQNTIRHQGNARNIFNNKKLFI